MKLVNELQIERLPEPALIQLLQGDLSAIPAEHAADILVMAAFPGNYIPLQGSLIYALNEKGLSVAALAQDKLMDLRQQLHCWLSKPLSPAMEEQFHFKKILCFEPGDKIKEPEEVVGDIFRCINTVAFEDDNNVLVMPVIGTGYQQVPIQKMLPALLQACHFWLQNGLPIQCIKIVVHHPEKAQQATEIFNAFQNTLQQQLVENKIPAPPAMAPSAPASAWKRIIKSLGKKQEQKTTAAPPPMPPEKKGYDYFLSYAHVHSKEIQLFVDALKTKNNNLSVFYDKDSIPPGGLWIQQISAAIQQAQKVLIFLSPDYDQSPVCWDEFQCAKLMEYNLKKNIIQTVYLYGHHQTANAPDHGNLQLYRLQGRQHGKDHALCGATGRKLEV